MKVSHTPKICERCWKMTDYNRAIESRVGQVKGQADNSHNEFCKNATEEHNSNITLLIIQSVYCINGSFLSIVG